MKYFVVVHSGGSLDAAIEPLRALGAMVDCRRGLDDLSSQSSYDVAVVDYDALSPGERAQLPTAFAGGQRRTRLIVVSGGACRADFETLFASGALTNLIGRNAGADLLVTVSKLFDWRGGLGPWIPEAKADEALTVTSSRDRARCREAALAFATTHGKSRRMAEGFCDAVDEFLTNALYNGPREADLAPRWSDRETEVVLAAGEAVTICFRADARRYGVSVTDPFGTLVPKQVTDYLSKCFRKGDDQVDTKQGGAGLGLYYVFERFSHFALNIEPGRSTEAIGLIDIDPSSRRAPDAEKSFNIFVGTSSHQ